MVRGRNIYSLGGRTADESPHESLTKAKHLTVNAIRGGKFKSAKRYTLRVGREEKRPEHFIKPIRTLPR